MTQRIQDETSANRDGVYQVFPSLPSGAVEAALGYAARKAKSERYIPFSHHDPGLFVSA